MVIHMWNILKYEENNDQEYSVLCENMSFIVTTVISFSNVLNECVHVAKFQCSGSTSECNCAHFTPA